MNLIERAKNILTNPKKEWLIIETETADPKSLLVNYVLPMVIISSLGNLMTGMLWAGTFGFQYYLISAVIALVSAVIAFLISSYVIDLLAPTFNSEKNINRSAQLVAYSNTAVWIAGFLSFIPVLGLLVIFAGAVYSIYLMYLGIGPLKKTPEDKKVVYMIIAFLVILVIGFIISAIIGAIFFNIMGYGYGGFSRWGW
jgi:hypothetical protein